MKSEVLESSTSRIFFLLIAYDLTRIAGTRGLRLDISHSVTVTTLTLAGAVSAEM
jgi:hypothetical protein